MDQTEDLKKDCISMLTNHKNIDPVVAFWSVNLGVLRRVDPPTFQLYSPTGLDLKLVKRAPKIALSRDDPGTIVIAWAT